MRDRLPTPDTTIRRFFETINDRVVSSNGARRAIIPKVEIVVVEDDPLVRDFVVDTLAFSVNRRIRTFDNGFAAWQYIQASNPIHIVFADIHIPDIDGLDLTVRIKATRPDIICILTSGNPEDDPRAAAAGADAILLKPYGVSHLLALMQSFVVENPDDG
jgi:CheY-like chemotaxis protein